MSLTVLSDLDDTLLQTNMEAYLPAYFQGLGKAFSNLASTRTIIQQIQTAVKQMEANCDPGKMLNEIFAEYFYLPLGTTEAACEAILKDFYQNEFPKLQSVTRRKPEAVTLVDWCRSQGFTLAVATNPLFPETATRQRINWAGLDPAGLAFFSTFDNFHFTKPNLTYYAEGLGRLGWPEGPIVMVGDNLTHDILPMEAFGCPTFWITGEETADTRPHGPLSEVQSWLHGIHAVQGFELADTPIVNQAILRSTPAVLDSWLRTTPEEILKAKPSSTEWSLTEIIWHMADMENEIYLPQWKQLLTDQNAFLTAPDTSAWAEDRDYQSRSAGEGWLSFLSSRMQSLTLIEELTAKGLLTLTVRHSIFSQAKLAELVFFSAKHDRIHLCQCKNLFDIYKIY